MFKMMITPWIDFTRWTLEWSRNYLDGIELICDTIENEDGY